MQRRKTTTSSAVKDRWNAKTYRVYNVRLRKDDDADLIQWIEDHKETFSQSDIFRAGLEALMKQNP